MKDIKIINVLQKFSSEELKHFGYFVHSPYHNRVKSVTKLFEILRKFYPDFRSRFLSKEALYKRITGKTEYNDAVMRNLFSDLYKLSGEFISISRFKENKKMMKLVELPGLKKFHGEYALDNEIEKLRLEFEKSPEKDGEYYFDLFRFWNTRNNIFNVKSVDTFHSNIESEIENLTRYYIIHLFDRFFQANRFRTSYKTRARHSFLEDVTAVLNKHGYMSTDVVKIYYLLYMLIMTMNPEHYYELKELLKENFSCISRYLRYIIFQSLSVFFLNMQRQGKKEFNRDRFELFRDYAASGEIMFNESFSDASYTAGVVAAIAVGEFKWAEEFTEKYRQYLDADIRQDAYYYNKARILHSLGKNEEALGLLARVISTHHPIKAVVKVIELQILYELDMRDSIELKLDSLRHFFSKNEEMNSSMKESLKNFHRTYSMIMDARYGNKKYSAEDIKRNISQKKHSYSMEWLREKIAELDKK